MNMFQRVSRFGLTRARAPGFLPGPYCITLPRNTQYLNRGKKSPTLRKKRPDKYINT